MIPRLLIAGLVSTSEKAIAAGMRAANLGADELAPMAGKILKLTVTDLSLDLWVVCGETQWWLCTESQETADVELSGTLGSLVDTARSIAKPNTPLVFEGLDIRGSVGVLQTMQQMFQSLNLDWEDVVTRALGPIPANALITALKTARSQWLTSRESLKRQATDFLRAEQKTLITEDEFDTQRARLTALDRQIDRLNARIKQVESKAHE